jgi:hypothetical protein
VALEKKLIENPAEFCHEGQRMRRMRACDTARGDVVLLQRFNTCDMARGNVGLVQGVVAGQEGNGRSAKVFLSVDSSMETVLKGKVEVYAIESVPTSSRRVKTSPKAPATQKNAQMRKHTPKKTNTTKKGKDTKTAKIVSAELPVPEYEKKRSIQVASNRAQMEALGLISPAKLCRNVASPRKSPRKSAGKATHSSPHKTLKRKLELSAAEDAADSTGATDDDEWLPKKPTYTLSKDACQEFKVGRWLAASEYHFVHRVFSLREPLTVRDNAVPCDYLVQIIHARTKKVVELPWDCCAVNTAPRTSGGRHWNLAMWRLHRSRVQITLWEPYSHNKYSAHIKKILENEFPTSTVNSFAAGVQAQGDGWSCGYICVWWQILVMKLIQEGSAPRAWAAPTAPPQRWVSLIWKVLRERNLLLESHDGDHDIAFAAVHKQIAAPWKVCMESGSLTDKHLEEMQTLLDLQGLTVGAPMFRLEGDRFSCFACFQMMQTDPLPSNEPIKVRVVNTSTRTSWRHCSLLQSSISNSGPCTYACARTP